MKFLLRYIYKYIFNAYTNAQLKKKYFDASYVTGFQLVLHDITERFHHFTSEGFYVCQNRSVANKSISLVAMRTPKVKQS